MTIQESQNLAANVMQYAAPFIPEGYEITVKIQPKQQKRDLEAEQAKAVIIRKIVCDYFNTTPEKVLMRTRANGFPLIRKFIVYFLKSYTTLILKDLGAYAGYCHSDSIKSIRLLAFWLNHDADLKDKADQINSLIINQIKI